MTLRLPSEPKRVLVVGVGGGGSHAVCRMAARWKEGPEIAVVNTDAKALGACGIEHAVQIGRNITQGLGAGGDSAVGRIAAEDDADILRTVVARADLVFLVSTLGGGTGTGVAPRLAGIAREEEALVIGFVSLPFDFEGESRMRQAREGYEALKNAADAVVCIPNQYLLELLPGQARLEQAFGELDRMLGTAIWSLWKLLTQSGMIALDFADLRSLVDRSNGACVFGYGEGAGPNKAAQALESIAAGPMLEHGRILANSSALLVSILGGDDMTLMDIQTVMAKLNALARSGAQISMGAMADPDWRGKLAVTVLANDNRTILDPRRQAAETVVDMKLDGPDRAGTSDTWEQDRKEGIVQTTLKFDPADRGRFNKVEPTFYNNEDLDIPTFIRKRVRLNLDS